MTGLGDKEARQPRHDKPAGFYRACPGSAPRQTRQGRRAAGQLAARGSERGETRFASLLWRICHCVIEGAGRVDSAREGRALKHCLRRAGRALSPRCWSSILRGAPTTGLWHDDGARVVVVEETIVHRGLQSFTRESARAGQVGQPGAPGRGQDKVGTSFAGAGAGTKGPRARGERYDFSRSCSVSTCP